MTGTDAVPVFGGRQIALVVGNAPENTDFPALGVGQGTKQKADSNEQYLFHIGEF